ncbi:IclR family transcriptional regulator [Allonocardiopsis opalescens]|uniref:IclR family transcriptional regulator n=1 Tax=Allonocardiopsis opalescens TaxID=1144618 RepID=A0A2T0Q9P4_9ACTN|nr:IclR family transcriptional regulator [Allonocardiopsis opalescens]PRY00521.1 IclR family transcriptional regulator [Allonocardiopsis opalescens]
MEGRPARRPGGTAGPGLDGVGTLERGLAILEHVGARGEASTNAVARELGLSRSAAYRTVGLLRELGYLEADPVTGRVRLGVRLVELGVKALSATDLFRLAPPLMRELAARSRETAYLAVADEGAVVYVAREQGPSAVAPSAGLGGRRPLHATALGKAWLAALPDGERRRRVAGLDLRRRTANTIVQPQELLAELDRVAERGWAVDNIESEPDVGCVAAAVLDRAGEPAAALSLAGPAGRVLLRAEELGRLVRAAAGDLSRRIGHLEPPA